ncbi:MAG: beta strand repeat-containing protein [Marmoricola sp.]
MRLWSRVVAVTVAVGIPCLGIAVPAEATLGAAPTVQVSVPSYNLHDQTTGVSEVVSGTSSHSPVSVSITDGTHTTAVQSVATSGGAYTATFSAAQVAALSDGPLTATASYNEIVDNPTGTVQFTKDTVPPVLQSTVPANGAYAKAKNFAFVATAGEALAPHASSVTLFDSTGTQVGGLSTTWPTADTVAVTPSQQLADGTYTADVVLVDAAGNTSTATRTFTLDSTTPMPPVVSAPATINASNAKSFTITGSTTPDATDSSAGEPGGTVAVRLTDSAATPVSIIGTATVLADGSWSVTVDASSLADGTIKYAAIIIDRAGNASAAARVNGQKDTVAPDIRGFAVSPPNLTTATGNTTTVTGTVSGSTDPGAAAEQNDSVVVTATDGTTTITAPAVMSDATGQFSVAIDTTTLNDGTITYSAAASDGADNVSAVVSKTNVKGALAVVSTSPAANGMTKNKTTVSVTFNHPITTTGTPSTLQVTNVNGTLVDGTVSYSADHKTIIWTAAGAGMPDAGSQYKASYDAHDALIAGEVTGSWKFTVKTVAPAAPTIATITNPINAANQGAVVITGTAAEVSGTISVTLGGLHATTSPDSSGNWTATIDASSLADGNYTASATETDPAGNVSAAATKDTVKDATAPSAPTITSVTNPITTANETAVVVAGPAAEVSGTISVTLGGLHATTSPDSAGNWTVTIDASSLADGNYTASATETDPAGNVSSAGSMSTVKDTAPPPPTASSISLAAIPAKITTGQTITLSGKVTQGTPAAYGQVRLISVSPSGHATTWATLTPSSTGTFSKKIAPRVSGRYYVVYSGDASNLASSSSKRTETVAFRVTIQFHGRTSGKAKLGGVVSYAPRGTVVRIYRLSSTRHWVQIGVVKVGSGYAWSWLGSVSKGTTVRAVSAGTTDDAGGTSASLRLIG